MINSTAYFTFDFLVMGYYNLLDTSMTIHHICATTGPLYQVYLGTNGGLMMAAFFCGELSNFPMHLRCNLKNVGKRYTKAYEASESAYIRKYFF